MPRLIFPPCSLSWSVGEEVIISRGDQPIARLVAVESPQKRELSISNV